MEFLKSIFGSSETGPKFGGVLTVAGASIGGYFFGGGIIGGLLGLAGGLIAAPIVNDLVFSIGRSAGMITPPGRDTTITPNTPTTELPAPVLQPSGEVSPTTITAPILENLQPPPPLAIEESFKKRERVREILVERKGNATDYDKAVTEARQLESQTDVFLATVDAYDKERSKYHEKGGKREAIVIAVKTALVRPDRPNSLTDAEIERFIPNLPAMTDGDKTSAVTLMAEAMPENITMFGTLQPFPLREYAHSKYVTGADDKPNPAKEAEWQKKTPLERLNFTLNALDDERYYYEYTTPIDWTKATGSKEEGDRVRKLPPAELLAYSQARLADRKAVNNDGSAIRANLMNMGNLAMIMYARAKTQDLVREKLGGVVEIYSNFRERELAPSTALAHEFAGGRLSVFNETGIAILEKDALAATKAPSGKTCQFMTYKDCTAPSGAKEVTLVIQKDDSGASLITHRVEGGIGATVDWNKAKLKTAIPVNESTITTLSAESGKTIGATIRDLVRKTAAAPMELAQAGNAQMQDLRRLFELESPVPDLKLASADVPSLSSTTTQPSGNQLKKTNKSENPFSKIRSDVTV